MSVACRLLLGFVLSAGANSAWAEAPGAPAPRFQSWTPLAEYEKSALATGGTFALTVPVKSRLLDVAFQPNDIVAPAYLAESIDSRGARHALVQPRVTTYNGAIRGGGQADFAKLSARGDSGDIAGLMRVDGVYYALAGNLSSSAHTVDVREVTAADLRSLLGLCAVADGAKLSPPSLATSSAAPESHGGAPLREIELGTEVDASFVALEGDAVAANARALSIVNLMNGVYERDLGVTVRVVIQRAHVGSDPYTSHYADELRAQFRSEFSAAVATPRDAAILFTNRGLRDSLVGVASIATACGSDAYAVAAWVDHESSTALIAAHELGHLLSAHHTNFGVMTPTLNAASYYFDASSQSEIGAFVASPAAACIASAASGPNHAPVIVPIGNSVITEGETLEFLVQASDADGDPLTIVSEWLFDGASFDANHVFRWTPPMNFAGCNRWETRQFEFRALDPYGASAWETVWVQVNDSPVNTVPTIVGVPNPLRVRVGQPIEFSYYATDPDGDQTYATTAIAPYGADGGGGLFRWTPYAGQGPNDVIVFEARDCRGSYTTLEIHPEVLPSHPHIESLSATSGKPGAVIAVQGYGFSGNRVILRFGSLLMPVTASSDTTLAFSVPKVKKRVRKRPIAVGVEVDGRAGDNTVFFQVLKR